MKALFLTFHGFHATNGISKKIHYQVRALEANGVETHLCYLSEKQGIKYRLVDQEILADYGGGIKGKLYKRFEFHSVFHYIIKNQINLVYIRSDHNANPFTIRLARKIKKAGIHVVMEIPTYPYDQEYNYLLTNASGSDLPNTWIESSPSPITKRYLELPPSKYLTELILMPFL